MKTNPNTGVFVSTSCASCAVPTIVEENGVTLWYCKETEQMFSSAFLNSEKNIMCPFYKPLGYFERKHYLEKKRLSEIEKTLVKFLQGAKCGIVIGTLPAKYIGAVGNLKSKGIVEIYKEPMMRQFGPIYSSTLVKVVYLKEEYYE
jgi:hypothetical protein